MGCHVSTLPANTKQHRCETPEEYVEDDEDHSVGCGTGTIVSQLITSPQQHLLQKTWAHMDAKATHHGMTIFRKIFQSRPDLKSLFPFKDVDDEGLRQDAYFRCHASHFMAAIGAAVENVEELDLRVTPQLRLLGKQHANMPGFGVDYFEIFTRSMLEVWQEELGEHFTRDVHSAWEKLFLFLLMTLRDGYLSAKANS